MTSQIVGVVEIVAAIVVASHVGVLIIQEVLQLSLVGSEARVSDVAVEELLLLRKI